MKYTYLYKTHVLDSDNAAYMNVNTNINCEILLVLGSTLKSDDFAFRKAELHINRGNTDFKINIGQFETANA